MKTKTEIATEIDKVVGLIFNLTGEPELRPSQKKMLEAAQTFLNEVADQLDKKDRSNTR